MICTRTQRMDYDNRPCRCLRKHFAKHLMYNFSRESLVYKIIPQTKRHQIEKTHRSDLNKIWMLNSKYKCTQRHSEKVISSSLTPNLWIYLHPERCYLWGSLKSKKSKCHNGPPTLLFKVKSLCHFESSRCTFIMPTQTYAHVPKRSPCCHIPQHFNLRLTSASYIILCPFCVPARWNTEL